MSIATYNYEAARAYASYAAAAVGIAGSLAVNALIPPQKPKYDDTVSVSSGPGRQAITGTRNTADPYGTPNKVYGKCKIYPKYAANPYTELVGQDKYFRCLFDVGQTPLILSEHKIGDTDLDSLEDVQIEVYNSNEYLDDPDAVNHYSIFPYSPAEQSLSIELTQAGGYQTRTTAEDTQEISIELTMPAGIYAWNGNARNPTYVDFYVRYAPTGTTNWRYIGNTFRMDFTNAPITFIRSIAAAYELPEGTLVTGLSSGATGAIIYAHGIQTIQEYEADGQTLQRSLNAFDWIQVEVISGEFNASETVTFTGYSGEYSLAATITVLNAGRIYGVTEEIYRYGLTWKVNQGQYDVEVSRVTADGRAEIVDTLYWTVLRSLKFTDPDTGEPAVPVKAPNRCLVALRIRATGQLNGIIDQYNCIGEAVLEVYNGSAWVWQKTRLAAWAYCDVMRGLATERPVAVGNIDLAGLMAWGARCTTNSFTFDAIIDFKKPVKEILADIASTGRASFGVNGSGLIGVVEDLPQAVPVAHIGPRNSWGYRGQKIFPDLPHAFMCRFENENNDYNIDEIPVYDDGYDKTGSGSNEVATKFETMDFWGVKNETQVKMLARYHIAVARLRPETHEVNQDAENLACARGKLVRFSHDVILVGLGQGRVKSMTYDGSSNVETATFDDIFPMELGGSYGCRFRLSDGSSVVATVDTDAGENYTVTFNPVIPAVNAPDVGDLCFFGEAQSETIECIVTKIEAGPDLTAKITMVDYAPAVQNADHTLPPWDSNITLPPIVNRPPPAPVIISTNYAAFWANKRPDGSADIRLTVVFEPGSKFAQSSVDIQGYEGSWRVNDGVWKTIPILATAREFHFSVLDGNSYDVRLRAYTSPGLYSDWATEDDIIIELEKALPPDVENLRVIGAELGGGATPGGESELPKDFVGRDCEVIWTEVIGGGSSGAVIDAYKVEIRKTDGTLLRTDWTDTNHYKYSYEFNVEDTANAPLRTFKIYVWAHNIWDKLSENAAYITVINPAPDMSGVTPTVYSRYGYLEITWPAQADLDMARYDVYCDEDNPPVTLVVSKTHPATIAEAHGLDAGTTYYVKIVPYDQFGVGTATQVNTGTIDTIPGINVESELVGTITFSDSDGNTTATLEKFMTGNRTSDGIDVCITKR